MTRMVVFLRGINVGGHTITKSKLQEAFTSLGYQNVSTYKQSGNVILETEEADPKIIENKVEKKLRELLGYDVAAFVRSISQLKAIVNLESFKGYEEKGTSFLVTFVADAPVEFTFQVAVNDSKIDGANNFSSGKRVF